MSKSIFETNLKQGFKQNNIEKLSEEKKKDFRLKTLDEIFTSLSNKQNRYIFYCPDMIVVNPLVETIYELAFDFKNQGYNVLILHEIKDFKCKWLYEQYPEYKTVPVEYIIQKRGKKSKKDTNQYSFKPSDTVIVPDMFLDVLENVADIKLVQKVLLVTSHTGISSLPNGQRFHNLGISTMLFLNEKLKEDYEIFNDVPNKLNYTNYSVDQELFKTEIKPNEVLPIVSISSIGNRELASQVVNIFYNKYTNLRTISFKIVDRSSYKLFKESINKSCLFVDLDKNSGFNKQIYSVLKMSVPVLTYQRRESDDFINNYFGYTSNDPYEIAEHIATFCSNWLNNPTSAIVSAIKGIVGDKIDSKTKENFNDETLSVSSFLQDERVKFFAAMKQQIDK